VRPFAWFALTTAAIAILGALILAPLFSEPKGSTAVWLSAMLAIVVQLATFAIARRYAHTGSVMTGWGIGALIRAAVLALYGLVGARSLGVPLAPALLSFAVFVFVSTVIEPLFLSR
jgi:hypothetical protein